MNIYHRKNYLNRIKRALKTEKLVVLYGQRQVGKTTLMEILLNDESLV
jgi:predicted AAA+ superfamily ATPase